MTGRFDSVTLQGVSKIYGRQRALGGVSLHLEAGRPCALLGGNGAGKSTLLGILSLAVRPTGGSVTFGDIPFSDAAARVRGAIGLVAHDPLVYRDLTGRENLRFFERLYGSSGQSDPWLARVGLAEAADRPVRTYSRGMLQRLALARALLVDPCLVLLDEPFSGLDRSGIELLRELLAELRSRGKIVLLVTHDLDATGGLCNQVAVLSRGKLAYEESRADPFPSLDAIYAAHA